MISRVETVNNIIYYGDVTYDKQYLNINVVQCLLYNSAENDFIIFENESNEIVIPIYRVERILKINSKEQETKLREKQVIEK